MCGRTEFELFVQAHGWTMVLVQLALALTKLNVKFGCIRRRRQAYERSQQRDSTCLSTAYLHLKAPEQLGQCGHARRFCPAPSQSAGAPRRAQARGSHLGRLPTAPQRENGSRLRACEHLFAICVGAHDSMASTFGRVRVCCYLNCCLRRGHHAFQSA